MNTDTFFIAIAILSSSFIGSWHCAAMCGPIASIISRRESLYLYHSGRGLGYIFLGLAGGYTGSFFLTNEFHSVRIVAGLIFTLLLVVMGVQTFRGVQVFRAPQTPWVHAQFTKPTSGFALGLLSIFLPCGWLYSYVMAAVATRSPWGGSLLMALFWVAGLPALSALPLAMKKTLQVAPKRKQAIAGIVLTLAGLYSLVSFYFISSHSH